MIPRNDHYRAREASLTVEARYGLVSTSPAGRMSPRPPSRAETRKHEAVAARRRQQGRPGPSAPDRTVLRQLIRAAAGSSTGWDDFTEHLRIQGVHVRARMSERNPGQITGYAVALPDHYDRGEAIWFGGGKLAPDLTLPQLHRRWRDPEHPTDRADARQAIRATPRAPRPRPEDGARAGIDRFGLTRQERQQLWEAAQAATARATGQITATVAVGADPRLAGDAAWAAADLLAVVAHLTERRSGGPYTDAARAFEHAGRDLRRTPHGRTSAGRRLRTATTALSALGAVMPSELRQLQVLAACLASLADAVARLRETQAQAAQAAASRNAAEQLHALQPPRAVSVQPPTTAPLHRAPWQDNLRATDPAVVADQPYGEHPAWGTGRPPPSERLLPVGAATLPTSPVSHRGGDQPS